MKTVSIEDLCYMERELETEILFAERYEDGDDEELSSDGLRGEDRVIADDEYNTRNVLQSMRIGYHLYDESESDESGEYFF